MKIKPAHTPTHPPLPLCVLPCNRSLACVSIEIDHFSNVSTDCNRCEAPILRCYAHWHTISWRESQCCLAIDPRAGEQIQPEALYNHRQRDLHLQHRERCSNAHARASTKRQVLVG